MNAVEGQLTVVPVVRDPDFRRYWPAVVSVWGVPTSDGFEIRLILQSLELTEQAHLVNNRPDATVNPVAKRTRMEVHELSEVRLRTSQAKDLIADLTRLLAANSVG